MTDCKELRAKKDSFSAKSHGELVAIAANASVMLEQLQYLQYLAQLGVYTDSEIERIENKRMNAVKSLLQCEMICSNCGDSYTDVHACTPVRTGELDDFLVEA